MSRAIKRTLQNAFKSARILRTSELERLGIGRIYLPECLAQGYLRKISRGLYSLPDAPVSENFTLAEAGKMAPQGIVCLLSALRFHGLTTAQPHEVWMALDGKARKPRTAYPALRFLRFGGDALAEGWREYFIDGVKVKIYGAAKTVADCFKYRNKIGLDTAIEALREAWKKRRCDMAELAHYARVCRVANVMRPYLENLP